jgi:phenylalanyl-tRNA synthetase beta chain
VLEKELGIGDDGTGSSPSPPRRPLGPDLVTYLGLDDTIFEIEITPNRPTRCPLWAWHARSRRSRRALSLPQVAVKESEPEAARLATVEIADPDLCPRYAARMITGLTVKPSPPWLAQRLRAVGLRPINNVVDVTNYVMWELGRRCTPSTTPRSAAAASSCAAPARRAHHHAGRPDTRAERRTC